MRAGHAERLFTFLFLPHCRPEISFWKKSSHNSMTSSCQKGADYFSKYWCLLLVKCCFFSPLRNTAPRILPIASDTCRQRLAFRVARVLFSPRLKRQQELKTHTHTHTNIICVLWNKPQRWSFSTERTALLAANTEITIGGFFNNHRRGRSCPLLLIAGRARGDS